MPVYDDLRDDDDIDDAVRGIELARTRGGAGMAIASIVLAIVAMIVLAGSIGWAVYDELKNGQPLAEDDPETMALGFAIMFGVLLSLVGGVLGFISVVGNPRYRVAAALGMAFNAALVLGTILVILYGMLSGM
jgi:hypothetical protein